MSDKRLILQNNVLKVEVARAGAELKSIFEIESGIEYLWQADPTYWGRSAPILFPIVGKLKDNKYVIGGDSFTLPQHGFARDSKFAFVKHKDDEILLELNADDETRRHYPFEFCLRADYRLRRNTIAIAYTVTNRTEHPMYFSIGSHPAFNIPFGAGILTDYYIEFDESESIGCHRVEEGYPSTERPSILDEGRLLNLRSDLFDLGAIIFKNHRSRNISIKNTRDKRRIALNTGGAPYLGIWSKPGAPFVCIEPWFGIADGPDSNYDFTQKEGIQSLAPGEVFETTYSITVD